MNKHKKINSAALKALQCIFNPSINDEVLILTDTFSTVVANAFEKASEELGMRTILYVIKYNQRPLKEIPSDLECLPEGKTIVLNIIKAFPEEIPFRIKWIFRIETEKHIKMGHMPGITEEMMLRCVDVDYNGMKQKAVRIINELNNASRIHITSKEGTDLHLGINGRKFSHDVGVKEGEMCNIPCGEVYCAPVETEADGVVVFNASIGDIGLLKEPLKVCINNGNITKIESKNHGLVERIISLSSVDDDAKVIGEIGIGLNPGALITGNMLEDEKSTGTSHIAFGNNADFPGGGKNNSQIHRDFLFYRPTMELQYTSGRKKYLLKDGTLLF